MSCKKCKMLVCLIALAAMMAWTGVASAEVVASFAGPKDFNGSSDYQNLDPVSIGLEGTVSLEYKPNNITGTECLWYCADAKGGNTGEYRLYSTGDGSHQFASLYLWDTNGYVVNGPSIQCLGTSDFHTLTATWKQGSPTLFTVDGTTQSFTNAYSLVSFTSIADCHDLGRATAPWGGIQYFNGTIRNVVVSNTYSPVPEPATCYLLCTGLIGLLAYAWRRRR